jgi:hypothetical protein
VRNSNRAQRSRQCCCAATPPGDTGDEDFELGAVESDDEDAFGGGCWWWQSMGTKSAKWVVPQWEVLAASDSGDGTAVEGRAGGAGSECKRGRCLTGFWGSLGIACFKIPPFLPAAALGFYMWSLALPTARLSLWPGVIPRIRLA